MKSLLVGEDSKKYGEICSTDKQNISHLSAAGSKKTPLCYSKVKVIYTCISRNEAENRMYGIFGLTCEAYDGV